MHPLPATGAHTDNTVTLSTPNKLQIIPSPNASQNSTKTEDGLFQLQKSQMLVSKLADRHFAIIGNNLSEGRAAKGVTQQRINLTDVITKTQTDYMCGILLSKRIMEDDVTNEADEKEKPPSI